MKIKNWHILKGRAVDPENDDKSTSLSVTDFMRWTDYSHVKPLHVIYQLSTYPALTTLYKILSSIAVTSCSAGPYLSRVRIIKKIAYDPQW